MSFGILSYFGHIGFEVGTGVAHVSDEERGGLGEVVDTVVCDDPDTREVVVRLRKIMVRRRGLVGSPTMFAFRRAVRTLGHTAACIC